MPPKPTNIKNSKRTSSVAKNDNDAHEKSVKTSSNQKKIKLEKFVEEADAVELKSEVKKPSLEAINEEKIVSKRFSSRLRNQSEEIVTEKKVEEEQPTDSTTETNGNVELNFKTKTRTVKEKLILKPPVVKLENVEPIKIENNDYEIGIREALSTEKKYVGAHTSVSGGLENSVFDAVKMGAKAFGLFLRSQRKWNCKPLEDDAANKFKEACTKHGFKPHVILPHGSYLLNCGSPKQEVLDKSRDALIDELKRCEKLGLLLYNFHPGSSCGEITVEECINRIAESINQAHAATSYVITVIENMSGQGNTIGGDFKDLRKIIDKVHDKSRIGVCLDTCHAFAAGYDLASEKGYKVMMDDFEKHIGFQYLKAVHLNDSKGKVGCHLDRHENIGKGFIGLDGFRRVMGDPRFNDMPMILETPWISDDINAKEIKLLYSYC